MSDEYSNEEPFVVITESDILKMIEDIKILKTRIEILENLPDEQREIRRQEMIELREKLLNDKPVKPAKNKRIKRKRV